MSVVSDTLREARQARRISLNQAALETRIRQSILEALEEADYAALPPRPFLRGLLRNYAVYLNLDADSLMDAYDVETGGRPAHPTAPAARTESPTHAPRSGTPPAGMPPTDADATGAFPFPPFQIPTGSRPNSSPETGPEQPIEAEYRVAGEDTGVPPPTAPLNLPQEPPTLGQRIGSTRIPEVVAILALGISLFFLVSIGFTQVQELLPQLASQPTARPTLTATAVVPPGSTPTGIPTLPQTIVPPTAVLAIEPTLTFSQTATVISTTEIISGTETATPETQTETEMTLEVQATKEMQVWVIADEDTVFNGTLVNETRSFTARSRIYVQVKNIENGRLFFQGTRILPRDQQERIELNRAWLVNPLGTPVIIPPTPYPSPVTATNVPTATPSYTATPTSTGTPTRTGTSTHTPTATSTLTASATASATSTFTRTLTATRTGTFTRTPSPSTTPTASTTPTPTATASGTATPTRTPTR